MMIPQATEEFWNRLAVLPFLKKELAEKAKDHAAGAKASWGSLCELICHHSFLSKKDLEKIASNEPGLFHVGNYLVDRRLPHPCQWNCLLGRDGRTGKEVRVTQIPVQLEDDNKQRLTKNLKHWSVETGFSPQTLDQFIDNGREYFVTSLPLGTPLLAIQWEKLNANRVFTQIISVLSRSVGWMQGQQVSHQAIGPIHVRVNQQTSDVVLDFPESGFLFQPNSPDYRWASDSEKNLWLSFQRTANESREDFSSELSGGPNKDRMGFADVLSYLLSLNLSVDERLNDFAEDLRSKLCSAENVNWKSVDRKVKEVANSLDSSKLNADPSKMVTVNTNREPRKTKNAVDRKGKENRQTKVLLLAVLAPLPIFFIGVAVWFAFFSDGSFFEKPVADSSAGKAFQLPDRTDLTADSSKKDELSEEVDPGDDLDVDSLSLDSDDSNSSEKLEGGVRLQQVGLKSGDLEGLGLEEGEKPSEKSSIATSKQSNGETVNKVFRKPIDDPAEGSEKKSQASTQEKQQVSGLSDKDQFVTIEDLPDFLALKELTQDDGQKNGSLSWNVGQLNRLSAKHLEVSWEVSWTEDGIQWELRPSKAEKDEFRRWQMVRVGKSGNYDAVASLISKSDKNLVLEIMPKMESLARPLAFSKIQFMYLDGSEIHHEIQLASPTIAKRVAVSKKGSIKTYSLELATPGMKLTPKFWLGGKELKAIVPGSPEYKALRIKKKELAFSSDEDPKLGSVLFRSFFTYGKKIRIRGTVELVTGAGPIKLTSTSIPKMIVSEGVRLDALKRQLAQVKSKRAKSGQGAQKKRVVGQLEGSIELSEQWIKLLNERQEFVDEIFRTGLGFEIRTGEQAGGIPIVTTEN